MKGPAQSAVESMIWKTASIACNKRYRKEESWYFKKRLCYGYLQKIKKDHNAKNCSKRRFCEVYNKKNLTTIHGYARDKVDNTQHQCNSETSEARRDDEVVACASLNTGMEVISMCVVSVKLRHGNYGEALET